MRKIRRAASVAKVEGWSIGVFGALTLLIGIAEPTSIAIGLAMMAIAFVEVRAAGRLVALDVNATRTLAYDQIVLATLLLAYGGWHTVAAMNGTGEYDAIANSDPQLKQMLEPIGGLAQLIMMCVYGTLMAVAVFGQGSMALYYFTRAKYVRAYTTQTPAWIIEMQRAGVSV